MPVEETISALAEMIQAGYVRYIGLSEVGPETIGARLPSIPSATFRLSIR
nr:aldo/keto reductase [Komagataeibacter sucrofermentans]